MRDPTPHLLELCTIELGYALEISAKLASAGLHCQLVASQLGSKAAHTGLCSHEVHV